MLFTGETDRSIDDKLRVSIPSEMRAGFATDPGSNIVYAAPGPNMAIWLWPKSTFEMMADSFDQSLVPDIDMMEFEQVLFSQSRRIEIDKSGRIRLPEALLALAGISDHVVILGVRDHLELRDPATWSTLREEKLSKLGDIMLRAKGHGTRGSQGESA